ncbi:MAG: DUF998 domain-containing protein [Candidatus Limnocylindrales bacterium]
MSSQARLNAVDRIRAAGIVWGPAVFITSWVAAGAMTRGYSPIRDHISDLDAIDAPTRPLMNVAFVAFAVAAGLAAGPLRRVVGTPSATMIGANAVLSIGTMLAPLRVSSSGDRLHAVVAGLGYVTLAVAAPSAAPVLGKRSRALAIASVAVGAITLTSLAASVTIEGSKGFWQRAGITTTDAWLMTIGLLAVTGILPPGQAVANPRER